MTMQGTSSLLYMEGGYPDSRMGGYGGGNGQIRVAKEAGRAQKGWTLK